MKQYRDLFGKKISKQDTVQAVIHTVRTGKPGAFNISRRMGIGLFKATRLVRVLQDAGITSPTGRILLKEDAAVNAALRQLKKGNR